MVCIYGIGAIGMGTDLNMLSLIAAPFQQLPLGSGWRGRGRGNERFNPGRRQAQQGMRPKRGRGRGVPGGYIPYPQNGPPEYGPNGHFQAPPANPNRMSPNPGRGPGMPGEGILGYGGYPPPQNLPFPGPPAMNNQPGRGAGRVRDPRQRPMQPPPAGSMNPGGG